MAATPLKILLFAAGVVVAAVGTAYFAGALDPWFGTTQQVVADLPGEGEDDSGKSARLEPSVGPETPSAEEDASKGDRVSQDDDGATDVVVPSFDVVRVEPDGSLVIAGSAAPDANVEVVAGSTVVGAAESGPAGDFAVVLDDPLDPGDYQIVLRATSPDGVAATSEETAVVSIPDDESGQVLALVEQPGEPSRLITVPEAEPAGEAAPTQDQIGEQSEERAGDEVAMADVSGEASTGDEEAAAASMEDEGSPSDGATAEDQAGQDVAAAGDTATEREGSAAAETKPETPTTQDLAAETKQTAETETRDASAEESSAEVVTARDSQPAETETGEAGSADASMSSGDASADEQAQMAAAAPESGSDIQAAPSETGSDDAQAEASQAEAPQAEDGQESSKPATGNVFIEAVEIDGSEVFVAGVAEAGRRVLVYANDMLLGQAVASPGDRFLVEAIRDLPVGDYIVRADVLADNGSDVIARAAVPFEREAGEAIAAVAPRPGETETQSDRGETATQAPEPAQAEDNPAAADDETEMATAEEPSQAQAENGPAEMSAEEGQAASEESGEDVAMAGGDPSPSGDESAMVDPEETPKPADRTAMADMSEDDASDGGNMAASQERDASMPDGGTQAAGEGGSTTAADAGEAEESGEAGSMAVAASDDAQDADMTVASDATETMRPTSEGAQSDDGTTTVATAPKLESVEGAVIIRRGDTLWHISRRVYGRGIRYTTIYLANDDQIRDPHWIWPGQVFRVPEKTDEGETAAMEALGDQLVPVPQEQ